MEPDCCDIFKALSVGTRVQIIEILKSKGPLGAKKIAEMIGVTPAAVSQHLRTLRQVGLVRCQRKGYWIPYEIDEKALESCRYVMNEVCTCGCESPSMVIVKQLKGLSLESLERYKKELQNELRSVEERIGQIERKKE
jgi:DNA-binding transcriptional ArsR family regulator